MTFRITHVGATGARHRFRLRARNNAKAIAWKPITIANAAYSNVWTSRVMPAIS